MRFSKCDRCKNRIQKISDKEVSLIGFHGMISSLDLCITCAPNFVKMLDNYANKKMKSKKAKRLERKSVGR